MRQPLGGVAVVGLAARLRADHDEAPRLLAGLLLEQLDQLVAADGLVGDHERVLHVVALRLDVDDDVLHG